MMDSTLEQSRKGGRKPWMRMPEAIRSVFRGIAEAGRTPLGEQGRI
jgi:hypothetical protein